MINREITIQDGRTFNWHEFTETIIKEDSKKIIYLSKSKANLEDEIQTILYAEHQYDEWNPSLINYEFSINILSQNDIKLYGETILVEKSLGEIKSEKAREISNACKAQIYSGYDSDALGFIHHYPANNRDQSNMIASVTDSYNPDNAQDWTTLFWCMDINGDWKLRPHTTSQIRKAGADGKASIEAAIVKNAQLQALIASATTQQELDLIGWTND